MMDWPEEEVIRRQDLFCTVLVRQFMKKICKYQNLMLKHNVNITDSGYGSSIHTSRSFDDDIELVLRENSSAVDSCKSFWNLGARLSVLRLFQWVSKIVQRTKAARILCHIDAIPENEIESTITEVARELSVAFEYQILMLYGDTEVIKLAGHAVSCLTTYLNTCDSAFTCSNLLQAILEVKPLTGNKKDVVRTKVVTHNGDSVCFHWKLWQIFKQPGLRIPADILKTKLEEKTSVDTDTACSSRKEDVGNLECGVTEEEPSICSVSAEAKTKNAEQAWDKSGSYDNMEKLRCKESKPPCPGTLFGKSITDFEQEIHGDIISVEEEMLDSLSESYSSEDAIASQGQDLSQEINDDENTAADEDASDSVQDTPGIEDVLGQEIGDKLISQSQTKSTENILTTKDIPNDVQPANDSKPVVATEGTFGIFNETDRYDVLEKAVLVETITIAFKTPESSPSLAKSSDFEPDTEYVQAAYSAAGSGPTNDLDVNYGMYNNSSPKMVNDSHISPETFQAGDKVKNVVCDVTNDCSYHSDTGNFHNDNSKCVIPNESEDSSNIYDCLLDIAVNDTSAVSKNLSNQVTGFQVIEEITQHILVSENPNLISHSAIPKHDTQTHIPESQLDQVISDHVIEDIEQSVPMPGHVFLNNSTKSKHDSEMNISDSQLNPVVTGHVIEDIEENIPYIFYGCFTPYGAKCRPNIYGFRGPLHVWNEDERKFSFVYNDKVTVVNSRARQISLTEGDIHQAYIPKTFCKH